MNKKIMVVSNGAKFIGSPVYDKYELEGEKGEELLTAVIDTYEVVVTPVPTQDGKGGINIVHIINLLKVGDITDLGESVIIDLENDSPYALQYTEVTTGIKTQSPIVGIDKIQRKH